MNGKLVGCWFKAEFPMCNETYSKILGFHVSENSYCNNLRSDTIHSGRLAPKFWRNIRLS
jgi:hypothetical protein